ncbi:DUF1963 domain-containing protein [Pseudomonas sp. HS6]|uniref:DUF1963 domain-containing protein n=1 Tax=Pseudomonas sp. HS6 TaxID=2850559 RepID=UPI002018EB7B|nr:DUF1963 domain-containing protein [Pseudomonas sp. HS6]UQS14288.1 hypothetical protein JJN09_24210 [Pseudomonas sp. HS6]
MFIIKTKKETPSHIGGNPVLPIGVDIPKSKNGKALTFFFTIQFPTTHDFSGYTLSFFSATEEFDETLSIPEMLNTVLKDAVVPNGFLKTYQKLFRAYLFKTEIAATSNEASNVKLQYLEFSDQKTEEVFGWAGKSPEWVLEDEAPSKYEGSDFGFLLQVKNGQTFEILEVAPPQKENNIFGGTKDRKKRDYFFFNENEVYFFGQHTEKYDDNVYIITQCD